ncbi:tRNA epoxyqueuosine(34) reductase QueG [Hymenobacter busanensis]|uniref:Epoxyqueuosine reductase n=1 Tax=Hymenobacter busanensis TaxID=2607656 RepID=A0A7L5A1Z0_9BACT|nr:tRNA epoxyqueuosine(34) reductase QueG [Hymenobacter busanensis]KAA9338547.1 tRNA epoxyqueuosine(34) reductase QueG [Hymenobacter busanensis]QHJ09025.1 tRNA epoxyqueuosine(34) reductase QueG [Hymenobacter busanensis]
MQASDLTRLEWTGFIKRRAAELGFMACGISKADFLEEEAPRLEQWLARGMQGEMRWMENHFDKRLDPRRLVEGAKSVISLLLNYYPAEENQQPADTLHISKYAYGADYHHVIKGKLKTLLQDMQAHIGKVGGRAFVDSAPVLDKAWAKKSGLGWVGKNSNLITPGAGSFYFIAELIVDVELDYDGPIRDYCGSCTRCLDACPTNAIVEPYVVDGSKCISYFTIELKDQLPASVQGQFGNWVFGCDICQDVCPWNRFARATEEEQFQPHPQLKEMRAADWQEITHEVFNELFRRSAVKRTGYAGLTRNIRFVAGDSVTATPPATEPD